MDFNLDVEYRGDLSIVKVFGEVDISTAPLLDVCLQEIIAAGYRRLALDLENCRYFDSEGLKTLIRIRRSAGEPGRIAICGARGMVSRMFQISGLDAVFPILPTVDDLDSADSGI